MLLRSALKAVLAFALLAPAGLAAADSPRALTERLLPPLQAIAADPAVIAAIKSQNAAHLALTAQEVKTLRIQWQDEKRGKQKPLMAGVTSGPVAERLKTLAEERKGTLGPVALSDNRDLLVAATDLADDYQLKAGDLWQRFFVARPGALIFSPVAEAWLLASVAVTDPATGEVVGVVTTVLPLPPAFQATLAANERADEFDVGRPQKLIDGANIDQGIAAIYENAGITGEGRRVTGDHGHPGHDRRR